MRYRLKLKYNTTSTKILLSLDISYLNIWSKNIVGEREKKLIGINSTVQVT